MSETYLTLTGLRFHSCHHGAHEPCAACGTEVAYCQACATAVVQITDKHGRLSPQRWGHVICAHCRALPQEKIAAAIFRRALTAARKPDAIPTAFEAALLHALS